MNFFLRRRSHLSFIERREGAGKCDIRQKLEFKLQGWLYVAAKEILHSGISSHMATWEAWRHIVSGILTVDNFNTGLDRVSNAGDKFAQNSLLINLALTSCTLSDQEIMQKCISKDVECELQAGLWFAKTCARWKQLFARFTDVICRLGSEFPLNNSGRVSGVWHSKGRRSSLSVSSESVVGRPWRI